MKPLPREAKKPRQLAVSGGASLAVHEAGAREVWPFIGSVELSVLRGCGREPGVKRAVESVKDFRLSRRQIFARWYCSACLEQFGSPLSTSEREGGRRARYNHIFESLGAWLNTKRSAMQTACHESF